MNKTKIRLDGTTQRILEIGLVSLDFSKVLTLPYSLVYPPLLGAPGEVLALGVTGEFEWKPLDSGSGIYVPLAGGTMTGALYIDMPIGQYGVMGLKSSGLTRWSILKNITSETGANVGSNFEIRRYDDAGAHLATPFIINRATGAITTEGTLTVSRSTASNAQAIIYASADLAAIAIGANNSLYTPGAAFGDPNETFIRSGASANGIYINSGKAATYIRFGIGGAERMRINANGSVSIGTTTAGAAVGDLLVSGDLTVTGGISATTQFKIPSGTVAVPGLAFSADTNLGIYRVGADIMGFSGNGTESFRFDCNLNYLYIGNPSVPPYSRMTPSRWDYYNATVTPIYINPQPQDGTSLGMVGLFRYTNTTGNSQFVIYKGDATGTYEHIFYGRESTGLGAALCRNGGRVLIGTTIDDGTSPLQILGLTKITKTGSSGLAPNINYNNLVVEGTGNVGMTFLTSGASSVYGIMFGGPTNNADGRIGYSNSTRALTFHAAGTLNLTMGTTAAFTTAITSTGDITAYLSDKRLKTNIKTIQDPLVKIEQIRGVEFDWIDDTEELYGFTPSFPHETGVIAQEIQEVIPDAVITAPINDKATELRGVDENLLTVNHVKIIPLLIEGMKELSAQLNSMNSLLKELSLQNKELKESYSTLLARVKILESSL